MSLPGTTDPHYSISVYCLYSIILHNPQALLHLTGITPTKIAPESPLPQENKFL